MIWALGFTASASAAGCSGSLVEHKPMYGDGGGSYSGIIGYLDIYYNSSTGNNCAMTRTAGAGYGHGDEIHVRLWRCTQTNPSTTCTRDSTIQRDEGFYSYYAGPVTVNSPTKCIHAEGFIRLDVGYEPGLGWPQAYTQTSPAASHC
jgi:hypothetical protein